MAEPAFDRRHRWVAFITGPFTINTTGGWPPLTAYNWTYGLAYRCRVCGKIA